MRRFIIYVVTCTVNGKNYVGQTSGPLPKRRHAHIRMTEAQKDIARRRIDYRDFCVFKRRKYVEHRRKPGCVWNWRNAVPWWGDSLKLIACKERSLR